MAEYGWLSTSQHLRENRLIGPWKSCLAEALFFSSDFNELLAIGEEAAKLPEGKAIQNRALAKAEELQNQIIHDSIPDTFSLGESTT